MRSLLDPPLATLISRGVLGILHLREMIEGVKLSRVSGIGISPQRDSALASH